MQHVDPYSILAAGYDLVMDHVDYGDWAQHLYELIQQHHPEAESILELGCGTGSLALELQPMGPYRYLGTDRAKAMIEVARRKAKLASAPVRFEVARFTEVEIDEPVDCAVLVYDGLNYLLEEAEVERMLRRVRAALRPGGVFLFDQSTPANSEAHHHEFEDRGGVEEFRYERHSRYDPETRLHTTTFDLYAAGRHFREEHRQRAYPKETVERCLAASGFEVEAAYHNFSGRPANASSERIHWVARTPGADSN